MLRGFTSTPLLAVLVLSSLCLVRAPVAASQDAAAERVLRIEWNSYPDTLDPQRITDINEAPIVGLGFEGLTRIDEELIEPVLPEHPSETARFARHPPRGESDVTLGRRPRGPPLNKTRARLTTKAIPLLDRGAAQGLRASASRARRRS